MDENYKDWKSIKFYEALLKRVLPSNEDVRSIIAPLYLLNDFRQYYDHLLSSEKKDTIKSNLVQSLGVESFEDIEEFTQSF